MYGNAEVSDDASVSNGAKVFGNALICGDAQLYGYPAVSGNACLHGNVRVRGSVNITGDADLFEPWHVLAIDLISTENTIVTFTRPKPSTHTLLLLAIGAACLMICPKKQSDAAKTGKVRTKKRNTGAKNTRLPNSCVEPGCTCGNSPTARCDARGF